MISVSNEAFYHLSDTSSEPRFLYNPRSEAEWGEKPGFWIAQYRKIAKVALRGKKQLLERLGIAVRTSPTAAQRVAPAKAAATRAARKNQ